MHCSCQRCSIPATASTWAISCSLPYTDEIRLRPKQELKTFV